MEEIKMTEYKILAELKETEKAYFFQLEDDSGELFKAWLPKSKITIKDGSVVVPEWLSKQIEQLPKLITKPEKDVVFLGILERIAMALETLAGCVDTEDMEYGRTYFNTKG